MPAVSKKQQRFFGMVRAAQKGEMKNPSSEVLDVASEISMKDAKKFAKTKHKGLPEKKKVTEAIKRDEYGDPIGGPKISKKQVKKNLASNAKDEKIVHSEDYEERAKSRQKFVDFYKKAKEAKAKKQADATRSDSRRHGIKFSDAKGSGRIKAGKKIYD